MQRENERYDRLLMAQYEVDEQKSRNVREARRELVNVKLRQFRKKQDSRRQPILPTLKR
jgi:hypothetical protein